MTAVALMIQGTSSDAGKSAFVTGLCRLLTRQGYSVAPFKPQNMALNSAVTSDGGEIGRAQALQAQACGIDAITDMNPVLLKPNSETGSQVIIQGQVIGNMDAKHYHEYKPQIMKSVLESYARLVEQYDIILIEGAGSPAEINLRKNDIANMGFAEAIDCPVLLIADIERGGVFAHLLGTLNILSQSEQNRIAGMIINRFRGDLDILNPGIKWLEKKCNKPVLAVIPYIKNLHLEAEDSMNIVKSSTAISNQSLNIVVPLLPKISNHTDFDPLRFHPQINLQFISDPNDMKNADLIILPGSKSVQSDLMWLRAHNWESYIQTHCRYGGKIIGICGGFQMLGDKILDPDGIESNISASKGLQFLDMVTIFSDRKQLCNHKGRLAFENVEITGYEIHSGISKGPALQSPAIYLEDGSDGVLSADGIIMGTYLHGLFESETALQAILKWAGLKNPSTFNYHEFCEKNIDHLANSIEQSLDMKSLSSILNLPKNQKKIRIK